MAVAVARLATIASLAVFAARRLVLLFAATGRPRAAGVNRPDSLCLVVPARNEAGVLDRTLAAVADLRPAARRLHVVLVDDGSSDRTAAVMEGWCRTREHWTLVRLDSMGGKGRALNAGIAASPDSELIVTCDADVEPDRDCLVELVQPFAERRVGAAGALLWPQNPDASTVSRYCALELWQHQLITSAGKDRLGLNPPALGWLACYRRYALEAVGGFPTESLGEDVEVTNALTRAGWETRFVSSARVASRVPERLPDYWRQHIRWSRGLFDALPRGGHEAAVPIHRRIEAWLLATGYLDRIVLGGATIMVVRGVLSAWIPSGYIALTASEALVALAKAGLTRKCGAYLASAASMFPVDLAASVVGAAAQLSRRGRTWHGRGVPASLWTGRPGA
jgi:cellulose synthase/poly-beta-1,6-N-acetylglucosamine synthase-like glycosyltransferase